MNSVADDWQTYLGSRLSSKGLTQIDGKTNKVTVAVTKIEDGELQATVQLLLSEKGDSFEVTNPVLQFSRAAVYSSDAAAPSLTRAAYNILAPRDNGGIIYEGMSLNDEIVEVPTRAPESKSPTTYNEWGTY